jgi:hypothetical protein
MSVTEVMAIGDRTNNAELMRDIAALGYLPEPVLDATYGKGRFWNLYRPERMVTNDLDPTTDADVHRDFRRLLFPSGVFASVMFDPPYKLNGTSTGIGPSASDDDYGVGGAYSSVEQKMTLIRDGLTECARLADQYIILKCQDQVVSGNVVWQTRIFTDHAERLGFKLVDMLHVRGYRAQPPGRRQLHARRDYSTALVFERVG